MLNKEMIKMNIDLIKDWLAAIELETDKESPCLGYVTEKRNNIDSCLKRLDYYLED